jgi:hypothetical protein
VSWTHHRARVAGLKRDRPDDDPKVVEAVRDLKAERLADHIKKIIDTAPPLTNEQRSVLAALLRPTGDGG